MCVCGGGGGGGSIRLYDIVGLIPSCKNNFADKFLGSGQSGLF